MIDEPTKLMPRFLRILGECVGFGRGGGDVFHRFRAVDLGLAADEPPQIGVERAEFLLDRQKDLSVLPRREDLQPIADDGLVFEHARAARRSSAQTFFGSKFLNAFRYPSRRCRIVYQLSPACPLQNEHLKQFLIVVDGPAPLLVVIVRIVRLVGRHPGASSSFGHDAAFSQMEIRSVEDGSS